MTDGIINIDIADFTRLLRSGKNPTEGFFAFIGHCVVMHGGKIWTSAGDGHIAGGFVDIDEAVACAFTIQRRMNKLNSRLRAKLIPILVRIGVTRGNPPDIPKSRRKMESTEELGEAAHLQKECPPGSVRISRAAFEALRLHRQNFRPSVAPVEKTTGALVWNDCARTEAEDKYLMALAPDQREALPPMAESRQNFLTVPYAADFKKFANRDLERRQLIILGETRESSLDYKPSAVFHPCSTSDAVGPMEILAAMPASRNVWVSIDEWGDTRDLAYESNLIVIGSPAVNTYAYCVNFVTCAGFHSNQVLQIRVPDGKGGMLMFPDRLEHSDNDKNFALVLLTRSPINPKYEMLWVAGICGMATQAASRFVCDLILQPDRTLDRFPNVASVNAAVVCPEWEPGFNARQYQGKWRVPNYKIIWTGRG